jgi:hypothetical protein
MQVTAMIQDRDRGRAIAVAARINAAAAEALAARCSVNLLEQQVVAARARADRLAKRLARIEGFARRAMAHTDCDHAHAALGDIVITARERDAPAIERRLNPRCTV